MATATINSGYLNMIWAGFSNSREPLLKSILSLESGNHLNRFLVSYRLDEVTAILPIRELPTFIVRNLLDTSSFKKAVSPLPMFSSPTPPSKRIDAVIRWAFNGCSKASGLRKVSFINKKGTFNYIVGHGIILNEKEQPIVLSAIKIKQNSSDIIAVEDVYLYVSPNVFLDNDDPLNKEVVKKLIMHVPFLSLNRALSPLYSHSSSLRPQVVISEEIDKFYYKSDSNYLIKDYSTVSQVLLDHINEIKL